MNWKTFISKMKSEYPKLTPDKLYAHVSKFHGKRDKTDIENVRAWWIKACIKWFKEYYNVPLDVNRKTLSVQKRIYYITKHKDFEMSWRIFHPVKVGNPASYKEQEYVESNISKKKFKSIYHDRNITRILQRAKVIK